MCEAGSAWVAMVSNSVGCSRASPDLLFCFCCSVSSAIRFHMRARMPDGVHALRSCEECFLSRGVQTAHDRVADAQERDTCHTVEMNGTHCRHRCCEKNNFHRLGAARNRCGDGLAPSGPI